MCILCVAVVVVDFFGIKIIIIKRNKIKCNFYLFIFFMYFCVLMLRPPKKTSINDHGLLVIIKKNRITIIQTTNRQQGSNLPLFKNTQNAYIQLTLDNVICTYLTIYYVVCILLIYKCKNEVYIHMCIVKHSLSDNAYGMEKRE